MKRKWLWILPFSIGSTIFFQATQSLAAQSYRFPFKSGQTITVTQSCIDSMESGCEHSEDKDNPANTPYSLAQRYAIDFGCNEGEPIVAIQDGTVASVVTNGVNDAGYGNAIKIEHSDGRYSYYAHMKTKSSLSVGSLIKQGDQVGACGGTGYGQDRYHAVHLHLELRTSSTLDINRVSTAPIYFDECKNNANCVDGQVVAYRSYTSINSGNVVIEPPASKCTSLNAWGRVEWDLLNGQIQKTNGEIYRALNSNDILISKESDSGALGLTRRTSPAGSFIDQVPWNCMGIFQGAIEPAPLSGQLYNWLKIKWADGVISYSAENFLDYVLPVAKVVTFGPPDLSSNVPPTNPTNSVDSTPPTDPPATARPSEHQNYVSVPESSMGLSALVVSSGLLLLGSAKRRKN